MASALTPWCPPLVRQSANSIVHDRALLASIQARDRVAERRFYDLHVAAVYRMACRMTRDVDLAEDLTQETFIRAFDRAGQYRGDGTARGWLLCIARSVILNRMAQRRLHRLHEPLLAYEELPEETLLAPVTEPVTFELRERLEVALAQLPSDYRTIVTLYHIDGLTHADIAKRLGITVQLSKVRVHRACARLRVLLGACARDWLVSVP